MPSFFTGTATVEHVTKLPASATLPAAIAMLHDHDYYLECDPHLVKYDLLPASDPRIQPPSLPASIVPTGPTQYYEVRDLVHNLPGGLWDSNVVSVAEMTNFAEGVFVRIRSPMSVVMDSVWAVRELKDGEAADNGDLQGTGRLVIVEHVTIEANRLVVGVVKGLCEAGWKKIHDKMLLQFETTDGQIKGDVTDPAKKS